MSWDIEKTAAEFRQLIGAKNVMVVTGKIFLFLDGEWFVAMEEESYEILRDRADGVLALLDKGRR